MPLKVMEELDMQPLLTENNNNLKQNNKMSWDTKDEAFEEKGAVEIFNS